MRLLSVLCLGLLFSLFAPNSALAGEVNVNTASAGELESLPGIGPSKAAAIVQYRTDHGAFPSVAALDNVPGIGPATLANLTGTVTVGDGRTVSASAAPAGGESSAARVSNTGRGPTVNINTANASALESLPGIGPSKAAAIVAFRENHGAFGSCEDLDDVDGIGPATVATLRGSCTTE